MALPSQHVHSTPPSIRQSITGPCHCDKHKCTPCRVLSTDQWGMYRSQGVDRTSSGTNPGTFCPSPPTLVLNDVGAGGTEATDGWEAAALLMYNRTLTAAEYEAVEAWLVKRYALGEMRRAMHRASCGLQLRVCGWGLRGCVHRRQACVCVR